MKALIDTRIPVTHITSWEPSIMDPNMIVPITQAYANSARICQIEDTEFDVHENLIWVECESDVDPSTHYYDTETGKFKIITNISQ